MGNPIKMDDWGIPLFLETLVCLRLLDACFHKTLQVFSAKTSFLQEKQDGANGFKFRQQIIPPAYCRFASL